MPEFSLSLRFQGKARQDLPSRVLPVWPIVNIEAGFWTRKALEETLDGSRTLCKQSSSRMLLREIRHSVACSYVSTLVTQLCRETIYIRLIVNNSPISLVKRPLIFYTDINIYVNLKYCIPMPKSCADGEDRRSCIPFIARRKDDVCPFWP